VLKRALLASVAVALAAAACAGVAGAQGDPRVAALQVTLHEQGLYDGTIDGVLGAGTSAALRSLQGVVVQKRLGSRVLAEGAVGSDVAELQFELAWHGFPSGVFDGRFGAHLTGAVMRFQRFAGLTADGVVGPGTVAALARPLAVSVPRLAWPLRAPVGDPYGPRGDRFHAGIDLTAAAGAPVAAAATGRVTWAGVRTGWGLCVVVAHGNGVRTLYAHLATTAVRVGERVGTGARLGSVGSTGDATGPHLHFEVRIRGAAVDPLLALS